MSDVFYKFIRFAGKHAFWASSRPVVRGVEHVPLVGGCLIAANHTSPYDIAVLIRHTPRLLDFVSIVEVFENPVVGWLYGKLNAFPLIRDKPDAPTVRTMLRRLEGGRVVVMFPEGGFRRGEASVVHSRTMRRGIGRIANLAKVPVVPAVLINTAAYSRPTSWLPLARTRYAVAFGAPIEPGGAPEEIEAALIDAYAKLFAETAVMLPESARRL